MAVRKYLLLPCVSIFFVCTNPASAVRTNRTSTTGGQHSFRGAEGRCISSSRNCRRRPGSSVPQLSRKSPIKDSCYKLKTIKARSECIQPLLEYYYHPYITISCPQLSLILADWECKGCPWAETNITSLLENWPPMNRSSFPAVQKTCSIAAHVEVYKTWSFVYHRTYWIGLLVGVLLLGSSFFGISSGSKNGIVSPVTFLHWTIPEAIYLGALWLFADIYVILAVMSEDYYRFCESLSTGNDHEVGSSIAYATVLFISVSRCLGLSSRPKASYQDLEKTVQIDAAKNVEQEHAATSTINQDEDTAREYCEESSWLSFVSGVIRYTEKRSSLSLKLAVLIAFLQCALLVVFIIDYSPYFYFGEDIDWDYCFAGQKDWVMGFIQISKLLVEFLGVVVYALGPQRTPQRAWLRRFCLGAILICTLALFVSMLPFAGLYNVNGFSMVIPRTVDQHLSFNLLEITHAAVVALLGLLEPVRSKILQKRNA